ncbi:MAG TPA: YggS family pyridoxal phosphate-dependent enzyme, partial [Kofleriaceae bacterium]|nr:YggS family pyridoxal phosphate-dependent enzyme [Kofleriaceae bacterium]
MTIAARWEVVRARVGVACERAGRDPGAVTIVAVSKTHPASAVREAAAAGATDFGENYAQELAGKRADAGAVRWHFIGRLQRNKAKLVAGQVALVHAVDSLELGEELAKRAQSQHQGPTVLQPVLISVNVAGEETKGGITSVSAPALAEALSAVPGLRVDGLMTMPPPSDDPETSRPAFVALRSLRDDIEQRLGRAL